MINNLYLDSERVSATGNVTSIGIKNTLGRPRLDPLEVLVREAIQNSWDAKLPGSDTPVYFGLKGWTLGERHRRIFRDFLFATCPPDDKLPLKHHLLSLNPLHVLAIYDRGTTGLGGPTRADILEPGEPRDFVDFLRNVGQPPDKELAGGTYGYGKAAFYRASLTNTIVVHTRCKYKGKLESRFMISALGEPYDANERRYTGRHWWGKEAKNGSETMAAPCLDNLADQLAQALGLSGFDGDECGTTLLIIQPAFSDHYGEQQLPLVGLEEERTPEQALNQIAEYILWYFWPKMLSYDSNFPAMQFSVSWQGKEIFLPDPNQYPPLQGFVQAMYRLKGSPFTKETPFKFNISDIISQRPKAQLGRLSLQQFPVSWERGFDTGFPSPFKQMTHHSALMRVPELIVQYVPGAVSSNENFGYAGVFITDKNLDSIFARSEPPTHDSWVPDGLEDKWHRTYVSVANRKIREEMDRFAKPHSIQSAVPTLTPLGAFANRLGSSLLPGETRSAATSQPFRRERLQLLEGTIPTRTPSPYKPVQPSVLSNPNEDMSTYHPPSTLNVDSKSQNLTYENRSVQLPPAPLFKPQPISEPSLDSSTNSVSPDHFISPHLEPLPKPKPKPGIIGRARVNAISNGDFVLVDNIPGFQVEFEVLHAGNSSGTDVYVLAQAVIDGGQVETEPPVGGTEPQVMRWISPGGIEYQGSESIFISAEQKEPWYVIISFPEDMMLGVDFRAEARQLE